MSDVLISLLDKAAKSCGGQNALARELGVSNGYMSLLRAGKRPITPELAGALADIAGEDVRGPVMRALLDSFDKTPRGQRVRSAIERSFLRGVAAIFVIFATLAAAPTPLQAMPMCSHVVNTIYIVSSALRTLVFKFWYGLIDRSPWRLRPHPPTPSPSGA